MMLAAGSLLGVAWLPPEKLFATQAQKLTNSMTVISSILTLCPDPSSC